MSTATVKERVLAHCRELGFDLAAVTPADLPAHYGKVFREWIEAGMHGDMAYLAKRLETGVDANMLLPGARSVICLAVNYYQADGAPIAADAGQVSRYAVTRDYHKVLGGRLKRLKKHLEEEYGAQVRTFVDIGPLLERAHAEDGGLGYIGKNTCLITKEFGSWVFLAAAITDMDLAPDTNQVGIRCGRCRLCIDLCPTKAIREDRTLDARRCISYLTIENRGPIPEDLRKGVGNWLFGCDICQDVCPHNNRATPTRVTNFETVRIADRQIPLQTILEIPDDAAFLEMFAGTPLMRARRIGLQRNACVVAGNSGRPELIDALNGLINRECNSMLVEHARWAVARLVDVQRNP